MFHQCVGPLGGVGGDRVDTLARVDAAVVLLDHGVARGAEHGGGDRGGHDVAGLPTGAGFGQLVGRLILLVQDSAPRDQLGVATTAVRFFQTLGNALGSAVFGSVLARLYAAHGPGGDITALARLTGAGRADGIRAFVGATQVVFRGGAGLMALAALLALRLPKAGDTKGAAAPPRETEPVAA